MEIWGDIRRCSQKYGDKGRYREIEREIVGDIRMYREIKEALERYREIYGDIGGYKKRKGDKGRYRGRDKGRYQEIEEDIGR